MGLPYKDKKLFSKYSLGMKQRLGIANAILHDPELLILDEPTNGLDPIGIAEVRKFIKNLSAMHGKTILISSHILSEISLLADDIGIIDHGVLLEENSMTELEKKNSKYILLQVIPYGKVITLGEIREYFAKLNEADFTEPITAGIFVSIAAWASYQRSENLTPYWRTLKANGELNPKYPGGVEAQKEKLEAEGHTIIKKGRTNIRYFVKDYSDVLFKLNGS